MKKIILLLFTLSLFSCAEKPKEVAFSKEQDVVKTNLDDYFTALTKLKKFNGVLLAYTNDTLVLKKAYLINDHAESTSYVRADDQFDIHSVSKLMTHYLIVKLKENKHLSDDQTIDKFYSDFPKGDLITIEMLLNHSSGLPRELQNLPGKEINLTSDKIVDMAKKEKLLFQPGSDIQYSNVGYELLYNIISKIYKKPFAQCIVDEIFVPLKMNHSGSHFFTIEDRKQNLAKNHILKDSTLTVVPNILEDEFKTARLYSTVDDLNRFLVALEKEPYKSVMTNSKGVIAKDGGSKGIRAQVYSDLERNFRFVLLANYDGMPFFETIDDVAKIMMGEPVEIPKELNRLVIPVKREILERYVGSYSFADFDGLILKIAIDSNNLVVFQDKEKIATLKAETETIFFENPKAAESFEFIKNDSGSYNTFMGWKGISVEGIKVDKN
ncbi:serine hydrolase domain-containing protein [Aestuariibaculum suncheonense]|uniref:Beta-lactamase family protein n=1 Tax=Aestuariibaculum suncheonense TaxID=1028745 RepID=A0A8J6Q8S8_9FLAO|nr:serine hydrolase domain-containing protein [Aestuariibaculum suncheonense]MBD0835856.1 beta-lactamase family protein [Aestuariibaculum suncheonense]